MRVEITDAAPDVHADHAGHMLLDAFDMIVLSYLVTFGVCCALCVCTGVRLLRRKALPAADAKKRA